MGSGHFQELGKDVIGKVLNNRALQTVATLGLVIDLDVGQTLGTVNLHKFRVAVDFRTRHGASAGHAQDNDFPVMQLRDGTKDLKGRILDDIGHFFEFEFDAQVGLVGSETRHRFGVFHDAEALAFGNQIHV